MNDFAVESYKPSDAEPFMNERQREYFRRKLIGWREAILAESRDTLAALQLESENHPDIADRASSGAGASPVAGFGAAGGAGTGAAA